MSPKKPSKKGLWFGLILLAAVAVILIWKSHLPSGPSPAVFPPAVKPPPAHYSGDAQLDTVRLLKALNLRLGELDLLKLLDREVETSTRPVQGKPVPSYRETFRLPDCFTPAQLARELTKAARGADALPLRFEKREDPARQETQYACAFGYSSEWTPVEVVFAEIHRPRVCLIIDDAGYRRGRVLEQLYALKAPLSLAIIPGLEFSMTIAQRSPAQGVEVLCHLPMEGSEPIKAGSYPYFLGRGLSSGKVEEFVREAAGAVPGCRGVNNHMGSLVTQDRDLMLQVCSVLKSLGLFFVDSRTSVDSAAAKVAASVHMPYAERNVFLDNEADLAAIRKQFKRLLNRARRKGEAVGIGHLHETTLQALARLIPEAQAEGFVFIYASEVVK